jgi:hypothetical protein
MTPIRTSSPARRTLRWKCRRRIRSLVRCQAAMPRARQQVREHRAFARRHRGACWNRPCPGQGSLAKRERAGKQGRSARARTGGKWGRRCKHLPYLSSIYGFPTAGRPTNPRRPRHMIAKPSTHWHATPLRASFRADDGETAAMWHLSDTPCMGQAPSIFYKAIHHPSPQGQRSAEPRCAWAPLSSRMARGTLISRDSFLPHEMPEHWSIDLT